MSTERATTEHATTEHVSGDLRVDVGAAPEPGLLRPAIEAALAGRAWPSGPEAAVARAVADAVAQREAGTEQVTGTQRTGAGPW